MRGDAGHVARGKASRSIPILFRDDFRSWFLTSAMPITTTLESLAPLVE